MNVEEIEENYKRKGEEIEAEFKRGFKNKIPLKSLEKSYRENAKKLREEYSGSMQKSFKDLKIYKKQIKKKEKEKRRKLSVENIDITLSSLDKTRIKYNVLSFKILIKIKNYIDRVYFPHISFAYLKTRYFLARKNASIRAKYKRAEEYFYNNLKESVSMNKKVLKNFLNKLFSIFKKKKKDKEKSTEKEKKQKTN